jgi:hypothetical protein
VYVLLGAEGTLEKTFAVELTNVSELTMQSHLIVPSNCVTVIKSAFHPKRGRVS